MRPGKLRTAAMIAFVSIMGFGAWSAIDIIHRCWSCTCP